MDTKKHFASLLEDHSPEPSTAGSRPLSSFRNGRRSETRGGDNAGATPSHSGLDLDLDLDLTQDPTALSCVCVLSCQTSQEDCARHRFIVWAAVKRNSSVRMTSQERLECPLLRCTQRFSDHEGMLRHLAGCRYLASGEYWCYDHMRVERFDDLKCKRCLGHPSKRRKMLHMAKSFFHSLGHKSKRTPGVGFDDDEVMLPPPPSYDSLDIPPGADGSASELPSTEILEIDSMEVSLLLPTPMPAPSDVIDPQALLMPAVPELDSTVLSNEAFMQWQPLHGMTPHSFPMMLQEDGSVRTPAVKPMLQLTTAGLQGRRQAPRPAPRPAPTAAPRGKGLSPSSSVRSTASTDTNATAMSYGSSMISPSSNWSGAWSMGSGLNTSMTSPVDGVVADDMFADALTNYHNDACHDSVHDFFSELPADFPILSDAAGMASDSLLGFDVAVPTHLAYAPEITLTDDVAQAVEIGEPEVEQSNMCCSETKSLVSSAWDALQEHIVSSMVKIQDHRENYLANQLGSMSIRTVATTGLRTLRDLINGCQPSSASDALCLIHLVYAFSLVLHEQETSERLNSLFLQSLEYVNGLPSNDRNFYRHLVINIWQPPDFSQAVINSPSGVMSDRPFGLSFDPKGKSPEVFTGDSLLTAARDFLDELETSLLIHSTLPLDVQVSDLHMTHLKDMGPGGSVNGALLATTKYVLEMLSQRCGDAGLDSRLREVYQRLGNGSISSVRRSSLPAAQFFGSFVPSARRLCDQIYERHDVGVSRRDVYHGLGVALIESLIPEFDSSDSKAPDPPLDDIDAFLNDLNSDAGNTTAAFADLHSPGPQTFGSVVATQAQLPTPTATSSGTPSSSQTTTPAGEQTQQPAAETSEQQQPGGKVEANSCCEICGYRPKGDPQWFKGSMAKHRKLQHSAAPPKIYKCTYPGCTSQYKNRPDNLRQHQIEKSHWVQGEETALRRPSKRKKVEEEE
ncbi:hypothetical protein C8A00DRAFT_39639 [Chaetomidium leptoderma]|uniref:Uncharacterized protein n=1 Tax=Chaetomidium leptoderma TaxID=669021 RepID=A0AAN7A2M0_9PEZI|nr:hypothetical protein C8A00DRAFT_39639 [Chaetomidium leptoderma]